MGPAISSDAPLRLGLNSNPMGVCGLLRKNFDWMCLWVLLSLSTGCSTEEFAGAGGASTKRSADVEENTPKNDSEEEGIEFDETETISDDSGETCIVRDSNFDGTIDFESPPAQGNPADHRNVIILDQYVKTHGVKFRSGGQQPIIRRTSRRGDAQMPSVEEAWRCILCDGSPSRNRLKDTAAENQVGQYILSSTAASNQASSNLEVLYTIPTKRLSFDLIDVDGDEVWIVEVIDQLGKEIPELTQRVSASGYSTASTGNGIPTSVEVIETQDPPRIRGFRIRGSKVIQAFGYAFDNFDTGIPSCD
jgi:hypothetical protein